MRVTAGGRAAFCLREPAGEQGHCGAATPEINELIARKICRDLQVPEL